MVVISNPPFEVQSRPHRKGWTRHFKISHLYFYISNCRLKKRPIRDLICQGFTKDIIIENKRKLYERQGCCCPHCGQHFEYDDMELHHVLPIGRFPELRRSIRNSVMLCRECHKEVHCNPWLNIEMMKQKAEEMGINLSERYNQSGIEHDRKEKTMD